MEVESGLPPNAPSMRYRGRNMTRASVVVTEREKAKAAELKVSARTVQRMRRRYRDQGLWGWWIRANVRLLEPTAANRLRVIAAATEVISGKHATSTGTKSRVIEQIRRLLDDEHGPDSVRLPSKATLYRLLEVLAVGRHTFGSAVTRRQTATKPDRVYTPTTAARPGELVNLDATPLDVMAVMDDG